MSFAIFNIVYSCRGHQDENELKNINRFTLLVDLTLIAAAAVVAGLILSGTFDFTLPAGTGNDLAWGCVGLGAGFILADVIAAIAYRKSKNISDETKQAYRQIIIEMGNINPSQAQIDESLRTPCHQIMNGLYLGRSHAFMQTTHFEKCFDNRTGRPIQMKTSNPNAFTTVITLCPLAHIYNDFSDFINKDLEDYARVFEENGIRWHPVGKMAADNPKYWEALVFDCTLMDSELAKRTLPTTGGLPSDYENIIGLKRELIKTTPIQDWFEPIFKEIDQGVMDENQVLVHCQAGVSRSASILVAYLINRFEVTSEQAINFLKSRRQCVNPVFAVQLKAYEQALRPVAL